MYFVGQVKCPLYMIPTTYTIYRQGYHSMDYEVSGKSLQQKPRSIRGVFPSKKCPLFHSDLNQTYSTYSPDRPSVMCNFLWNIFNRNPGTGEELSCFPK